jgi:hypothetical protein
VVSGVIGTVAHKNYDFKVEYLRGIESIFKKNLQSGSGAKVVFEVDNLVTQSLLGLRPCKYYAILKVEYPVGVVPDSAGLISTGASGT